jgi:(p)ppGpp synthase/HD superfamily hydrolase
LPYILHPLRVMCAMPLDDLDAQIVAVLHDVVEDAGVAYWDHIKELGLTERAELAIEALTKREDETYKEYITRISQNELATKVKIADLRDNTLPERPWGSAQLRLRYAKALYTLVMADHIRRQAG